MAEFRIEMDKLKEYIASFKDKLNEISVAGCRSSLGLDVVLELYEALEACSEAFNVPRTESRNFAIPDELLTPKFSSDNPILILHESVEHLKQVRDFLIEFHAGLQNLSTAVPQKPKKIVKPKSRKPQVMRLPEELLRSQTRIGTAPEVFPAVTISHPEPPTIIASRSSIDKNLLGTDYVPFNSTVPDGRMEDDDSAVLNEPSTSCLPPIQATPCYISEIKARQNQKEVSDKEERYNISNNISEQYNFVRNEPEIIRDNIAPEGAAASMNVESIPAPFESLPHSIPQQSVAVAEVAAPQPVDIDENGLEIMQQLAQQKSLRINAMTRPGDRSSSSDTDNTQIISARLMQLEKTKFRKIRAQIIILPQEICEYQISLVDFPEFAFIQSTKALIDDIIKIRSAIEPCSMREATQEAPIQQIHVDEIQTELEGIQLTRSHSVVQAPRSDQTNLENCTDIPIMRAEIDQQHEIPLATVDSITEQPSLMVQSQPKSPLPGISAIIEPHTGKQKPPDASYANFESVLQKKPSNIKATPRKDYLNRGLKSLRDMSETELVETINHDQYVTLCTLREIRQNSSTSNRITIKSIQAHFSADRFGYCKVIRTAIDLQCHDIVRILKNGTEISGIEIFED